MINGTDTAYSTPNALHYARVITWSSPGGAVTPDIMDATADVPNYPVNGDFVASKWSLIEHSAVPEPIRARFTRRYKTPRALIEMSNTTLQGLPEGAVSQIPLTQPPVPGQFSNR